MGDRQAIAMRYVLLFACALLRAHAAGYDPAEVIQRVTAKVLAGTKNIPNYTCVETVRRDYYEPIAAELPRACDVLLEQRRHRTPDMILRPYSTDRLRLDVAMSSRGEIFSWSGANRFEDGDVDRVVHYGPMSTGSFGVFLIAIFETDVKKFDFVRSIPAAEGSLMEFAFQVAQRDSHYKMKLQGSWVFMPYSGRFQVSPATGDVVTLTVESGEPPSGASFCQTATTMEFAKVRIGGGEFLLPRQAVQRFIYVDVREAQNTTVFTNCREFRGESTLRFSPEEAPPATPATRAAPMPASLPAGLTFSMALTAPVQTATAAAGDPFSARLTEALRDRNNKVIAPKGSMVEGRLLRVQSFARPPEVIVAFRPEAVWVRGSRIALSAIRDWTYLLAERRRERKGLEILVPLHGEENSGVFRFNGNQVTIPNRFQSDWKTVVPLSPPR